MCKCDITFIREHFQRFDLIFQACFQVALGDDDGPPPKTFPIRIRRVRPRPNAELFRHFERGSHAVCITRMAPAGYVARGYGR